MGQKVIGNIYTGNMVDNSQDALNQYVYRYFNDIRTFTFKYGLELSSSNPYSVDEDPTIFGFDIRINTITSPLFTDVGSFFNYIGDKINEVNSRANIYEDFLNHLYLFFDKTDTNLLQNFKSHYIKKITGLDKLVDTSEQKFTNYTKDKITISMSEDVGFNGGYLAMLYKTLSYSRLNGKLAIPENLLRFDMDIIVSEIRNYNRVLSSVNQTGVDQSGNQTESSVNALNVVADNMSRYVYHLYDCQFEFDSMSHDGSVSNENKEPAGEFEFNILYKFSTLEMQKWSPVPTQNSTATDIGFFNYINNENKNPALYSDASPSSDPTPITNEPYIVIDSGIFDTAQQDSNNQDSLATLKDSSLQTSQNDVLNPQGGSPSLLDKLKQDAVNAAAYVAKQARNKLLLKVIGELENATGFRKINSPTNIYVDNYSPGAFIRNEIHNFANLGANAGFSALNTGG